MGITIKSNTTAKATLKLRNQIASYLFEQECGELKGVSKQDIALLKEAVSVLNKIITK